MASSLLLRHWINPSRTSETATPTASPTTSPPPSSPSSPSAVNLPSADATNLTYDRKLVGKEVMFKASKSAECEVEEGMRALKDYMALPPSQYSVLDADAIVRLSEDSFR
ncbi:hypothetical protein NSK_002320 [Nannochloropsis salina CCMP1776]|uniref:Uncharacterized protein n=1 Tax=Nannochloropsis salina CCMP1776 TaxID=1027361 RepID=A0A4D9D5L3_9STRA|nr:hypothetical protein NSK_002320 [Nannochloropsis salina CCMP1776]|eukprot:TFJ86666.1 hypothetical protein NSK_002320 [Nannochloropsis salina CCMP1776]